MHLIQRIAATNLKKEEPKCHNFLGCIGKISRTKRNIKKGESFFKTKSYWSCGLRNLLETVLVCKYFCEGIDWALIHQKIVSRHQAKRFSTVGFIKSRKNRGINFIFSNLQIFRLLLSPEIVKWETNSFKDYNNLLDCRTYSQTIISKINENTYIKVLKFESAEKIMPDRPKIFLIRNCLESLQKTWISTF